MKHLIHKFASSPSKTLFTALLAWTLAVAARTFAPRDFFPPEIYALPPERALAIAVGILVACVFLKPNITRLTLTILAITSAAIFRTDIATANIITPTDLSYKGILRADVRPETRGTTLKLERIESTERKGDLRLTGFTVRTNESVTASAGDVVRWTCKAEPRPFATTASCTATAIAIDGQLQGPMAYVIATRLRLREAARAALPEPDSSLLLGFVVGERDGIPKDTADAYRDVGVSHVLAASGSNVGWVVGLASLFAALHRITRRNALIRIAAATIFFAAVVGGDPPITRAAIAALIALTAESLGRRQHKGIALALTAALMLAWDPLLIADSVAFRLSFSAILGLALLSRPLEQTLTLIPEKFGLGRIIAETTAASLMTLPIVLHDFGRFPTATLVANALLMPVFPYLIGLGALAIATALIWPPLALPFAIPFSFALRITDTIIAALAKWMPARDLVIDTTTAVALYIVILALRYVLVVRLERRRPVYD